FAAYGIYVHEGHNVRLLRNFIDTIQGERADSALGGPDGADGFPGANGINSDGENGGPGGPGGVGPLGITGGLAAGLSIPAGHDIIVRDNIIRRIIGGRGGQGGTGGVGGRGGTGGAGGSAG